MDLDLTEQVCSILQLTCFRMRLCHGLPGHAGSFLVPNLPSTLRLCWSSWSRSARSFELHPGLLKRKPLGPMSLHPGLLSSASWHQVGKKKRMYHSVCEERETFFSKLDEPPHVLSFGLLCCILGGCWTEFLSPLARAKTSLGQGV